MVRAGSSSSSSGGGGGEEAGGGGGGGGVGAGRRGRSRSRQRTRRRRLSANCPGSDKMSPGMKKVECFSPMLCHCKVACTNSTISLMFGCKVGEEGEVLQGGRGSRGLACEVTVRAVGQGLVQKSDIEAKASAEEIGLY